MTENSQQEYIEFGKRLHRFINQGESIQGTSTPIFYNNLYRSYSSSHLYMVEESTKKLLLLTKPPIKNSLLRLPFRDMFIGCHFTKEEVQHFFGIEIECEEIFGILLQEGRATTIDVNGVAREMEMGNTLRVIACCQRKEEKDGKIMDVVEFNTFHINVDYDEDYDEIKVQPYNPAKNIKKLTKNFAMNVLNLIHDPEVQLITRDWDAERNKKRILKGQSAIPSSTSIRLTGKRKIYVDRLLAGDSFKYSHSFWVCGHYRHFRSDKYKDAKDKIIFVEPFVKGSGILIEKDYEINEVNE